MANSRMTLDSRLKFPSRETIAVHKIDAYRKLKFLCSPQFWGTLNSIPATIQSQAYRPM